VSEWGRYRVNKWVNSELLGGGVAGVGNEEDYNIL